ncbi:hypothetical protein [Sulfurospirillum halorespirans]|uniref:Uncharacterized protein n=1 Tax=Sulfurospirillum halorespirans DSM 13726 TaxID=1193502 RepID=A0A1D7TIL9_9BACT|nr:hypothetical protein [Sulfurospirillum halorespirans]AOO64790.1 hypothetical protein SHALO_1010 [Sulfurospirillum halorespirans DSM 13726]
MSFPTTVDNLPTLSGRGDFNIFSIKKLGVSLAKQKNILQKLAFIDTFEELSKWVEIHSNGKNFIANPLNAGDADREVCLTEIQKPLFLALENIENRRINGRDKRLIEAAEAGDLPVIADIIASAAWTYWQNHNFQISQDVRINISAVCQFQNDENIQQKKDFQKAQIVHIGAAVEFTKALKKGAFQEVLDFEETEEILKINDFED